MAAHEGDGQIEPYTQRKNVSISQSPFFDTVTKEALTNSPQVTTVDTSPPIGRLATFPLKWGKLLA